MRFAMEVATALRPVEFTMKWEQADKPWYVEKDAKGSCIPIKYKGFFHGFSQWMDGDGQSTFAIVEHEDGQLVETHIECVKFTDFHLRKLDEDERTCKDTNVPGG